jgi:thiamine pyrophosphokinase
MPAKEVEARAAAHPIGPSWAAGAPFVVSRADARGAEGTMRAVIVAAGDLHATDGRWLDGADLVVAADGGATSLDRLGRQPDRLVGDLDSVDPALVERLERAGTRVERHPVDKDASDAELALETALAAGATELVVLGAIGGERLDHELANLLLLTDASLAGLDLRAVRGPTTIRAVHAGQQVTLDGRPGDLVTLLPIGGDASGVTTRGLRWELADATLRAGRTRGLSNEAVGRAPSVSVGLGTLLVVEHRRQGAMDR